uniref:Endonuclease V n=1 Tax=Sarcophilus harrisii TaxID=9305 RepID=G3W2S1_SARHA
MAHEALGYPLRETLSRWEREQARLKTSVIDWDTEAWQRDSDFAGLHRVGGVDISFIKGDDIRACASLVVLSYPELEVLLVDGNGILHHRGFGVACHIGILTNLPCIGVAKKLLQVDGLKNNDLHKQKIQQLKLGGDTFPLVADSGTILGMALKSHNKSTKPLYVSVGHKVSLGTAVRLIQACCKYRIPEPIRQADIRSREYIRRTPECANTQESGQERGHEGMRKKQSPTLSPSRSLEESAGEERPENPSPGLHS